MWDDLLMAGRRFADVGVRGPRRMPLVGWRGNLMRFFGDPFGGLVALSRWGEAAGDRLVAIADRHPAFVCGFGPEINRRLLTDRATLAPFITPLRAAPGSALEVLYDNPFVVTGEMHRCHRRMMMPSFHRSRVAAYRDVIVEQLDAMMAPWQLGEVIDAPHVMQGMTLSVIMAVVFGLDERRSQREAEAFRRLLTDLLDAMGELLVMFVPIDVPGSPYRRMRTLAERYVAEVEALARRQSPGDDVLTALLTAPATPTRPRVAGQLFSLLTAGHETTYAALSWALMLLAAHPRVLGALYDELHGALRGEAPRVEQLGALPLLDGVVRESLRVLPTAPYGARRALEDIELVGHRLPAGAVVIYSHYVTHHMPELYASPERFDPRRWETIAPSPYEYLPFGTGPRTCIGVEFARLELKLALAAIVQRWWPELVPGARVDCRLRMTLRPHPGLPLRLRAPGSRIRPARLRGTVNAAVEWPVAP